MKRRKFLSTATTCALATPFLARAATGKAVLVQRTLDAPPRCMRLDSGEWTGFEIEASRMLCDKLGITLQPMEEETLWARALKMVETGDIDLLANVTWRPERAAFMDFVGPYAQVEFYVVLRAENADTRFETLEDFTVEGRLFDVNFSSAIDPEFDERLKSDPDFAAHFSGSVATGSINQPGYIVSRRDRLMSGRVFGVLAEWPLYDAMRKLDTTGLPFEVTELVAIRLGMFKPATNYICVGKHVDPALRADLHAAYRDSRTDGSFDRIWTEWYGEQPLPPTS